MQSEVGGGVASGGTVRVLIGDEVGAGFRDAFAAAVAGVEAPRIEVVPGDATAADVLVVGGMDPEADIEVGLRAGVRWIQALTSGVEKVLVPAVVDSDVAVTNTAGVSAGPVAEFVFARILERAKRLRDLDEYQRRRRWESLWTQSLAGSTLTVVGLGPVGRTVARLGRAFGMHVVGVRRRSHLREEACDEVAGRDSLPAVLARSDFLVLASALTPETRGLYGPREIAATKEGCLVVNAGRGELVDHDALVDATSLGRVHAALDVFPGEPLAEASPLWAAPGIAISPHCAPRVPEIVGHLVTLVVRNLERFGRGEPLENRVDKRAGYASG